MIIVYCYARCSTCQKALKWLESKGIEVDVRSITEATPSAEELKGYYAQSGKKLRSFFNTSGMKYRELKLSERLPEMSEDEQLALLASDGMLIKRPLLIAGSTILLGFKEAAWAEALGC